MKGLRDLKKHIFSPLGRLVRILRLSLLFKICSFFREVITTKLKQWAEINKT